MGYTHYWRIYVEEISDSKWEKIVHDFKKLVENPTGKLLINELLNTDRFSMCDEKEISFNGIDELAHETMCFEKKGQLAEDDYEDNAKRMRFSFCKTARKPYDDFVVGLLVIAKKHLGDKIEVSSDGVEIDWLKGSQMVRRSLGYGSDCKIDSHGRMTLESEP